jgi:hypothetical protein
VAVRYACTDQAKLRVRIRRGEQIVMESAPIDLPPTRSWEEWRWSEVRTPALSEGWYRVELFQPAGSPDIDLIALHR